MAGVSDYDLMLEDGLFDVDYGIIYTDATHEFYLLVEMVNGAFGEFRQTLIEYPKAAGDERISIHSRVYPKLRFWILETNKDREVDLTNYLTKQEAVKTYQTKGDYVTRSEIANVIKPNVYEADYAGRPDDRYEGDNKVRVIAGVAHYNTTLTKTVTVSSGYHITGFNVPKDSSYIVRTQMNMTIPFANKSGYFKAKFIHLSDAGGTNYFGIIADETLPANTPLQLNLSLPLVIR